MKNNKFFVLLSILSSLLVFSCNKVDNFNGLNGKEGGLYEVNTSAIIYNLGTQDSSYNINLKYSANIKRIDIYQQFFTTDIDNNNINSDVKLLKSLDLSTFTQPGFINTSVSFDELAAGTSINGTPIPTEDVLLRSGFYWLIYYKAVLEDGREVTIDKNTIFVNAKFAGKYSVLEKEYYRIGVLRNDLDPQWQSVIDVSALNATTYIIDGHLGPFPGAGKVIFSIVDDGSLTLPISYFKTYEPYGALTINGQPPINCAENAGFMTNVHCSESNVAIKGVKDTLVMSFGYFTEGSGPREFYQKLVKL
jgi:hypothetical protein